MVMLALLLQLQAGSLAEPADRFVPRLTLFQEEVLAQAALQGGQVDEPLRFHHRPVKASQLLAGTGLYLTLAVPALVGTMFAAFCGLGDGGCHGSQATTAEVLGLAGIGVYFFGAPAMAVLGTRLAADGQPVGFGAAYGLAILINAGAAAGAILVVIATHQALLAFGLALGLGGAVSSLVAAAVFRYPGPPATAGATLASGPADQARPLASGLPAGARPQPRLLAPLASFSW